MQPAGLAFEFWRFFLPIGDFSPLLKTKTMDAKLQKIYYSSKGYWKGFEAIKHLATAAESLKMLLELG